MTASDEIDDMISDSARKLVAQGSGTNVPGKNVLKSRV